MGSSKQESKTNNLSTTNPWSPVIPYVTNLADNINSLLPRGLSDAQNNAISGLSANASQPNQYAPAIGNLATDLLGSSNQYGGRVNDAFNTLSSQLMPTASGAYLDPNTNPFFKQTTESLSNDAFNRLAGMYAGSGRDPSGAGNFAQNAGRGIAEATAPIYANVYNTERSNQLNAANTLYGGANTATGLLSGLDQTALGNRMQGVGVSNSARDAVNQPYLDQLQAESLRSSIPSQQLASLSSLLLPIAQLGGQTKAEGSSTQSSSQPIGSQILGGAMSAAGLLGGMGAFGPSGWMFSGGRSPLSLGSQGGTGGLLGGLY